MLELVIKVWRKLWVRKDGWIWKKGWWRRVEVSKRHGVVCWTSVLRNCDFSQSLSGCQLAQCTHELWSEQEPLYSCGCIVWLLNLSRFKENHLELVLIIWIGNKVERLVASLTPIEGILDFNQAFGVHIENLDRVVVSHEQVREALLRVTWNLEQFKVKWVGAAARHSQINLRRHLLLSPINEVNHGIVLQEASKFVRRVLDAPTDVPIRKERFSE